jgi:hypothetical protein
MDTLSIVGLVVLFYVVIGLLVIGGLVDYLVKRYIFTRQKATTDEIQLALVSGLLWPLWLCYAWRRFKRTHS